MEKEHWDIRGYPGGGKSSLVRALVEHFSDKICITPRVTERPRRPSDNEWEYIFLTPAEYREWEKAGKILCSTEHTIGGVRYKSGIIHPRHWPEASPDQIRVSIFGSKVTEVKKIRPKTKIVFIDCTPEVLKKNLQERCLQDGTQFTEKWARVQRDMNDIIEQECDYVIHNKGSMPELLAQFLALLD